MGENVNVQRTQPMEQCTHPQHVGYMNWVDNE